MLKNKWSVKNNLSVLLPWGVPRVWKPAWNLTYHVSCSPLADCRHPCAKLGCVWLCCGQHKAATRRDTPPPPLPPGIQDLFSIREIIPPVLWKNSPPPNHLWCCRPILATLQSVPGACGPCRSSSELVGCPVASDIPGSAFPRLHWPDPPKHACQVTSFGTRDAFLKHPFWKIISIYQCLTWNRDCLQARMSPVFDKMWTSLCKSSCSTLSHNVTLVQQNIERKELRAACICEASLLCSRIVFSHFLRKDYCECLKIHALWS